MPGSHRAYCAVRPERAFPAVVGSDERSSDRTMTAPTTTGPNPLCEVGRTHPRDRHRMRPLEGYEGVWVCVRHGIFAQVIAQETADGLERGDPFTLHDGLPGIVVRHGDERPVGVLLYYRAADA